jgi:2'-hydroxyisoflavone reductase
MKLLILGGTKFLGRHLVEAALAGSHQVTLFNRGKTNPGLFPGLEKLAGDRDGNLDALKQRRWDAVIDTCGFVSTQVRAAAGVLAGAVGHYTFISSISVYRDFSRAGQDESAPLAKLPEGATEAVGDGAGYGARKVLCEQAAENMLPGRVLKVRPGILIGPHDDTGRFNYWVRRIAAGGEVLAPGKPETPVQLIDARDVASWTIGMVERQGTGAYNVTGPAGTLTLGRMLDACQAAGGNPVRFSWVAEPFLLRNGVAPFSDLPFWIPADAKEHAGFFAVDCTKARKSGLKCRPLVETARDTLLWERETGQIGSQSKQVGLSAQREADLLSSWKLNKS